MKAFASVLPKIIFVLLLISIVSLGQSAPTITIISPTIGPVSPVGGPVTIKGTGFGATQNGSTVGIGGISATPNSWSDTQIVVPVPSAVPVGFANVVATVNGTSSNSKSFIVIPVITQISPLAGVVGTSVTITGTSFGTQQNSSTITINDIAVTPIAWSDTSITAPTPNTFGLASIVVTVNGFSTNSALFPITPNITQTQPLAAPVGTTITINGSGFESSPGSLGLVTFNGTAATITSWNTNSITTTVPVGATSGNIVITTASNLVSSGVNFNVIQPLAIVATASPLSNAAGWNNTPVVVSFQCSGGLPPVVCPPQQTMSTEGANQVISGTASDSAGSTASASVTVSIDTTPPVISLGAGFDGSTVSRQILRLTGSISDNLSGVASASCGGFSATILGASFSCNIPLGVGVNSIQVQAADFAGNSVTSTPLSVTYAPIAPTAIFITPTFTNMTVGQVRTVKLVGNLGQQIVGAAWTISDPTVVGITADDPPQLTALTQGTATLNASFGGLSASMTITVVSGSLPAGTLLWSIDPTTTDGLGMARANPINDGGPDIYLFEDLTIRAMSADGQQLWATQVSSSGAPGSAPTLSSVLQQQARPQKEASSRSPFVTSILATWKEQLKAKGATNRAEALLAHQQKIAEKIRNRFASTSPSPSGATEEGPLLASTSSTFINQIVADNSGGSIIVLSTCPDSNCQTRTQAFTRVENASQQQTWTTPLSLDSNEVIGSLGDLALGLDDTAYASVVYGTFQTDLGLGQPNSAIVAIDNQTGQLIFTLQIPSSHFHFTLTDQTGSTIQDNSEDQAAQVGPIAVMPDGTLRALVSTTHFAQVTTQGGQNSPCGDPVITSCVTALSDHIALQLLVLQPDGSFSMQPVQAFDFDATNCAPANSANPCGIPLGRPEGYVAQDVIPDDQGGTLAQYTIVRQNTSNIFQAVVQSKVRRINSGGGIQDFDMSNFLAPFRAGENTAASAGLILGENNVAYGTGLATLAFDVTNGAQLWHTPFTGPKSTGFLAATNDSRLIAKEQLGSLDFRADALESFDSSGTLTSLPLDSNVSGLTYFDPSSLMRVSPNGQAQLEVASTTVPLDEANVWNLPGGNKYAQRNPNVPKLKITKLFAFVDKDGFTQTKNVSLVGIANGQTERIRIASDQSAKAPSSFSIQLSLQTDTGSRASAMFADGTTQMAIQPTVDTPTVVQIKGVTPSTKANDISLIAKIGKRIIATQKFSVVSVSVSIRSGTLGNPVPISPNNTAKTTYQGIFGESELEPFPFFGDLGCSVGTEYVGQVTPSDYKGHVILRRILLSLSAWDASQLIGQITPNRDDTSNDGQRDDDPQSDKGKVYDLDAPGVKSVDAGHTFRTRQNFKEYAVLDDASNTIPASSQLSSFMRVSCVLTANGPVIATDIPNDNVAGSGCTPLSFDLQGSCP